MSYLVEFGKKINCHITSLVYDPNNKQQDYLYVAKSFDDTWVEGYIVIDKPLGLDSKKSTWNYYICYNYKNGKEAKMEKVQPKTIMPLNQVNQIKEYLDDGWAVELRSDKQSDYGFAIIYPEANEEDWKYRLYEEKFYAYSSLEED